MNEFLAYLMEHMNHIEALCDRIETRVEYLAELRMLLPQVNQSISVILSLQEENPEIVELNQAFVSQVLKDLVYGIEKEDGVYLLDVLRYGLLPIYGYVLDIIQRGEADE